MHEERSRVTFRRYGFRNGLELDRAAVNAGLTTDYGTEPLV
ncbi:hypothetical protein [Streptomyces sp. NPDC059894]